MRRAAPALLLSIALAGAPAGPSEAAPPPEGDCPVISGEANDAGSDDVGVVLREGMVIGLDTLLALRSLLPPEVWAHREAFFFEGMRMEIGACHRRFPRPAFYSEATLRHWEESRLDDDGNLDEYVAGLPFPPDRIDPAAPDAGTRWAWNLELRYRGAGPAGSFRLTDLPSRIGGVEIYKGSFFLIQTRHRADLPETDYAMPEADKHTWVGGGRFDEPFHARHLAWRQLRPLRSQTRYKEADRMWVYVPDMRKPRRAMATWVDGFYTPRYSASQQIAAGGGVPFSVDEGVGGLRTIHPTASVSAGATAHIRRGFVGMAVRPNAYDWEFKGETDVIAPLNGAYRGWPLNPDRNFGPSGLSVAQDTWDVRRAVVIEGRARRSEENVGALTIYMDYQTQQPLYWIARRYNGLLIDVGILVHRFSGDDSSYPAWTSGERALVFDPVAASFYSGADGGTGWRRESYDVRSIPASVEDARRMTSVQDLERGH